MKKFFGTLVLCAFVAVSAAQAAKTVVRPPMNKAAQKQAKLAKKQNAKAAKAAAKAAKARKAKARKAA